MIEQCDTYASEAMKANKVPLNVSLSGEFANHRQSITELRDEIEELLGSGAGTQGVQQVVDRARSKFEILSNCKKAFDAAYQIHYKEKE